MEKTFDKILADEQRRALEDKQIDHYFTKYEVSKELDASVAEDLLKSELLRKDISETGAFTPAELATYEAYWDAVSVERTLLKANWKEGFVEGFVEGFAEGFAEGLEIERKKREEKKLAEKNIQTVLAIKKAGFSIDIISTITKLTIDEISEILKQYETTK